MSIQKAVAVLDVLLGAKNAQTQKPAKNVEKHSKKNWTVLVSATLEVRLLNQASVLYVLRNRRTILLQNHASRPIANQEHIIAMDLGAVVLVTSAVVPVKVNRGVQSAKMVIKDRESYVLGNLRE